MAPIGEDSGRDVISPELALVDPELAAAARATLVEPTAYAPMPFPRAGALPLHSVPTESRAQPARRWLPGANPVLVGVAAATVAVLVFFDVRVEVRNPTASAEQQVDTVASPTMSTPPPVPGATRPPVRDAGATPATAPQPQRFAWEPVPNASTYHVELFRAGERVFSGEVGEPTITVPAHWTLDGRRRSLSAGDYAWFVWAIVDGRRGSRAIVQARFTVGSS